MSGLAERLLEASWKRPAKSAGRDLSILQCMRCFNSIIIEFILQPSCLKIWFDISTPKQVLFFESMVRRLEEKHTVLCTSRIYREATELAKIRGFHMQYIGRHGGKNIDSKLDASLERMQKLSKKIQKFAPDIAVSSCSPDAARIAFGLGIKHIGFTNTPNDKAAMRLSLSLLTKLLIPSYISKRAFAGRGLSPKNIIQYDAMDEFLIIKNKPIAGKLPKIKHRQKKTILFRVYESQASYISYDTDIEKMISTLAKKLPGCSIVVIGRYADEIKDLAEKYAGKNVTVLDRVVDSGAILSITDLFIGSGGTMTTEAVLRGIPAISYEAAPNLIEKYLVSKKLLIRAKTPERIVAAASKLLASENRALKRRAQEFLSQMSDPYDTLISTIQDIKTQ